MTRRLIIAAAASLLMAGVLATPASAAPAGQFRFSTSGPGVDGFWSTFPADGNYVANVVYTDTFVSAAEQAIEEDGTTFTDKFAFVDIFSYKIDRRGNFVFVSDTFGFAAGDDVSLSVARDLSSASLKATVALSTCTERTCSDAGTGQLAGKWVATGPAVRVNGTTTITSPGFTETVRQKGTFRDASAVGSLDGAAFGASLYADINNTSFSDHFICHGC
ncbi:MAG TPA: hypothetical protein VEO91_13580 [Candidatus Limnocylindria bacterium]|nr:hypothetical protein [Candidatus Limnocylindria bacterium]